MLVVIQEQIDSEAYKGAEVLDVDPPGGGVDVVYRVNILLDVKNSNRRLIQWKLSDEVPDVYVGEGMDNRVHFIGIPCANDERVAFVECSSPGTYSFDIPSFSEISDTAEVRRVFCAALRPTTEDFTFFNPIENVVVPASPDTLKLQINTLNTPKEISSGYGISFTHAQSFPCVFGIIYKHIAKGEITASRQPILRSTFSFNPKDEINYCFANFDAGGDISFSEDHYVRTGGVWLESLTLTCQDVSRHCKSLIVRELGSTTSWEREIVRESDNLMVNDNELLSQLVANAGLTELAGNVRFAITVPPMSEGFSLTLRYREKNAL